MSNDLWEGKTLPEKLKEMEERQKAETARLMADINRLIDEGMQLRGVVGQLEKKLKEAKWKADPEIAAARASAIRALVGLLPNAVRDARKGKPALLRLIIRSLR